MRQDVIPKAYSDVLRKTEARSFAGFPKLRSVRIEGGKILGEWRDTADSGGWWNPFATHYRNRIRPPYMALARCGTSSAAAVHFHESCGPVGEKLSSDFRSGIFSLDEFKAIAWQFRFTLDLLCSRSHPVLQKKLLEHIEKVQKRWRDDEQQRRAAPLAGQLSKVNWRWGRAIMDLRDATGLPPYPRDKEWGGRTPTENALQRARDCFASLNVKQLVSVVRRYLAIEFQDRLAKAKLRLDFPDGEAPRLVAECPDLLTAFYWMLASDSDAGRAPLVCANCKKFFFSSHKAAAYCKEPECRKHGRMKLNWEKHKEKYNRTRRAKYRRGLTKMRRKRA